MTPSIAGNPPLGIQGSGALLGGGPRAEPEDCHRVPSKSSTGRGPQRVPRRRFVQPVLGMPEGLDPLSFSAGHLTPRFESAAQDLPPSTWTTSGIGYERRRRPCVRSRRSRPGRAARPPVGPALRRPDDEMGSTCLIATAPTLRARWFDRTRHDALTARLHRPATAFTRRPTSRPLYWRTLQGLMDHLMQLDSPRAMEAMVEARPGRLSEIGGQVDGVSPGRPLGVRGGQVAPPRASRALSRFGPRLSTPPSSRLSKPWAGLSGSHSHSCEGGINRATLAASCPRRHPSLFRPTAPTASGSHASTTVVRGNHTSRNAIDEDTCTSKSKPSAATSNVAQGWGLAARTPIVL